MQIKYYQNMFDYKGLLKWGHQTVGKSGPTGALFCKIQWAPNAKQSEHISS